MKKLLLSLFLVLFSLIPISLCYDEHVTSVEEFISFSDKVNNGADYSGTTVFLDNDIDFNGYSDIFIPIGNSSNIQFGGELDGQGHTISNLVMNSTSLLDTGIFGSSKGSIIKNVVVDSSCSFSNFYNFSKNINNIYVGSIIGYGSSTSRINIIENIVNMASVVFGGYENMNIYIGGIIGSATSHTCLNTIRNCVNFGSVTSNSGSTFLGGIAGYAHQIISGNIYIQNCINYGTITYNGTSSKALSIGGIAGYSCRIYFNNCVNSGKIISSQENAYIGAILGSIQGNTEIAHCLWTSDTGNYNIYGYNHSDVIVLNSSLVSLNETILDELNEHVLKESTWNKWVTLHMDGGRINNLTQSSIVGILKALPILTKEGNTFLFWCKDPECTTQYNPETDTDVIELYAGWTFHTVTFDFGNGTVTNETYSFNTPIAYPKDTPVREGHTFIWNDEFNSMPARDIIITARWNPNNYTVTFDFGNGTIINETFTFNTFIEYPNLHEKEGYQFTWNNEFNLMPAKNIIITLLWVPNNYTVTFDFDNGTVINEAFTFNTFIEYPNLHEKEGYQFTWDNIFDSMPAKNITITLLWVPNNYTVKFDANGGDDNITIKPKEVIFSNIYGDLPRPTREGYIFNGWYNVKNESVTNKTIVSIASNHTLYAQWGKISSQVEIVFNTNDITEEEIETTVKQYVGTDAEFNIIVVKDNESDEIKIIINFVDSETAEGFFEYARTSNDGILRKAEKFSFIKGGTVNSFSVAFYPMLLILSAFI